MEKCGMLILANTTHALYLVAILTTSLHDAYCILTQRNFYCGTFRNRHTRTYM